MDATRLKTFIELAADFEPGDANGFQDLVAHAVVVFEQLQEELSDELGVNPSSVSRWKNGKARPHKLVQQMLARKFADKARLKLEELKAQPPSTRRKVKKLESQATTASAAPAVALAKN